MKALTLLTVRCRGAPEVKAFMLEKRVSPHGNVQTNWRVCAHFALTSLCDHAHGHAPPTETRVAFDKMDALLLGTSLLLLAAICKLEHV